MAEHTNPVSFYFFGLLSDRQEFSQKIQPHQFWVLMVPQLHAKYIKNIQWPNKLSYFGLFGPLLRKQEFFQKIWLYQFWVLWSVNFMQNMKKNQRVNNPDKSPAVTNKWTNWGILGFSGPFSGKREFSQKIWLHQLWVLMVPQLHAKC